MEAAKLDVLREMKKRGRLSESKLAALEEIEKRQSLKRSPSDIQSPGAEGYGQAFDTIISGAIAEPIAGAAGLLVSLIPGLKEGSGAAVVERVRDNITIDPRTQKAKQALGNIAEFISPVTNILEKWESALGDKGYEIAGPVGGAVGRSIPTAIGEAAGIGLVKGGAKALPETELLKNMVNEQFAQMVGKPIVAVGDDGMFSYEALKVIEQQKGAEALEQAKRFNLFAEYNVPATRFDVTQSTDDAISKQSALKRTGPVSERVAQQDARLAEVVGEGVERLRPTAASLPEANSNVFNVVGNVVGEVEEVVTEAYRVARESASGTAVVKPVNLVKALRERTGRNELSGGVISAVRGDLENRGFLDGWKLNEDAGMRIEKAEELRQVLNSYYEGANPQGRKVLRDLKDALDEDVSLVVPVDVFEPARQAKSRMHSIIERGKRDKRDKTKGSLLESILDNTIPEEKIITKIYTSRKDDLVAFKRFLTQDAGPSGVQAFNDIKAEILRSGLEKATGTMGKGEGGQVVFNANKFKQHFANLRSSGKLKEIYSPEEIKLIDDVQKIGMLRIPQGMVQQGKGPSQLVVESIAEQVPGVSRLKGIGGAMGSFLEDRLMLDPVSEIAKPPRAASK